MKGKVIILTLVFTLIISQSVALAGGLLDGLGKGIQYLSKQYAKESDKEYKRNIKRYDKEQKAFDKKNKKPGIANQKQMERALKDIEDMEKPPLQRPWLQKIDIYKEVIEKSKNSPSTIQDVIDHIEIFGKKKYGEDKLSQKHKDFQQELINKKRTIIKERSQKKVREEVEKMNHSPLEDVKDAATGVTILGGIAYILRIVVFRSPM